MRIAILSSVAWRTPPLDYGPWELVASLLTERLVARGEDVTLFATADSVTSAALEAVLPHGYATDPRMDGRVWEAMHVGHALELSGGFDVVHSHLDWLPLALGASWGAPLLTTVHGFSGAAILPAYARAASNYVSISDSDRAPELDYLATVHHGVDLAAFTATVRTDGDLVVLGRIHPDKGTAVAIEIARRAGRRLLICGPVVDEEYFAERVAPHVDGERVIHLGSIGAAERDRVLGASAVLLHPIAFAEPFGLAVIEAMACGTPVVAYRRGSMPELIDEGVTGFVVDGLGDAVAAVDRAASLDRSAVRTVAERRFGVDRMVDEYLAIYRRLVAGTGDA
ncbi:MAG: glycosyltransferase family 4 protein [Actinomycetota bacterium]|nr:glycosyltransferase family 4 protein [Actinomycetota bacterium]